LVKLVLWFNEISKDDVSVVGGKNANLGEMTTHAGVPVPPFFAVTAEAYRHHINSNSLQEKINETMKQLKDPNDTQMLQSVGKTVREMIYNAQLPDDLKNEIINAYKKLGEMSKHENIYVAVRSSATAEDLPGASFAGQQETFLNVSGADDLLDKVKKCFASLYTDRAIFYRVQKGFEHEKVALSVAVQKMVNSRSAGVMFTIDPATGDTNKIVIEGSWGLGEAVVSGAVTPDHFVIDKNSSNILKKEVVEKTIEYVRDREKRTTIHAKIDGERAKQSSITDEEIKMLTELAKKIDQDLPFPESVFITQSRPETVWEGKTTESVEAAAVDEAVVCEGLAASPGTMIGVVRIAPTTDEMTKVQEGDILVTKITTPDWVPVLRKVSAVVTEEGGVTSHAAIVSRELGIPCIVGTRNAMSVLKDGGIYSLDAKTGKIYEGEIAALKPKEKAILEGPHIPTKTNVYMNLGVPEKIEDYKKLPFDGIGLMRIEFIIASYVNEHPNDLLAKGEGQKYIDGLAEGIAMVAKALHPRPVVVRFSDFKTNEYRALKGGEKYEPEEANPMIGWRGVSRYVSKEFEECFRLECRAIKKVRDSGLDNVWVMFPFVRTTWEVEKAIAIMESEGLKRSDRFKVWLMLEVPSVALIMDEFCELPIDGFSIGSNDLTQMTLGVDRDSEILVGMGYFDERNPAVLKAIEMSVDGAIRNNKTISICGQAPSVYPEVTEFLVKHKTTSVSVNPDTVVKTRQLIADFEKKLEKS
jgi:pyruvate,water dikinase